MMISLKKIREKGACASGQRWFKNHFGTRSVSIKIVLKALLKRKMEFDQNEHGYSKWLIASFYPVEVYGPFNWLWGWNGVKQERKAAIKWAIENALPIRRSSNYLDCLAVEQSLKTSLS